MNGLLLWLVVGCGVGNQATPDQVLASASEEVIFASVETIGPHKFQSVTTWEEFRDGESLSQHVESLSIEWNDWDHFSCIRVVDGRSVLELVVNGHLPFKRHADGSWRQREDAEPYRVQLRGSWNAYAQFIEPFSQQLLWTAMGTEMVAGRKARKYTLALDDFKMGKQKGLRPVSLEGMIWVDEESAVRLLGEVNGVLANGGYTKKVGLKIERSQIGEAIKIETPVNSKKDKRLPSSKNRRRAP